MQLDSVPGTQETQPQNIGAQASTPAEAKEDFSITGLPDKRPIAPSVTSAQTESIPSPYQAPAQQFVEAQEAQPQNTEIPTTVPAQQFTGTQETETQPYTAPEIPTVAPTTPETVAQPAQDVVAGLDPAVSKEAQQAQTPSSEADVLKTMEAGNADLTTNSGTPLADATSEQTQNTPDNPNYSAVDEETFKKWEKLSPTELTLEFNTWITNLRKKAGILDTSAEEGLVRVYTTLLLRKTGIKLETDLEKKWN